MESSDDELKRQPWIIAAAVAATSFMLLFGVFPLVTIVRQLLTSAADFESAYGWKDIAVLLWQSSSQAALSALLTLMAGLPVAFLLSRFEFVGRRFLYGVVMLPFILPTMVTALGLRGLFAGVLAQGLWLVVVGHVFVNIAVVVRFVGAAIEQLDERLLFQARSLGASGLVSWLTIGLPLLRPAIVRSGVLVFGFCFSSLSLILVLGTRSNRTFETEVLRQVSLLLDFRGAAFNTVIQLVCIALVLVLGARWGKSPVGASWQGLERRAIGQRWGWRLFAVVTAVAYLAPLAWLVRRSFSGQRGWSAEYWNSLLQGSVASGSVPNISSIGPSIVRSIFLALVVALVAVLIAAMCASLTIQSSDTRFRLVGRVALMPMMLTSATVGLGMLLLFSRPPFEWQRGGISLVLAQSLIAIPIAYAFILNKLEEVDSEMCVAAAALGSSPGQAWWTTYGATLMSSALAASGLAMAIAMGEYGAASFLSDYQSPNLTVVLMRLLGRPSEAALSYSSILALVLAALALFSVATFESASRRARRVRQ